MPSRTSLRAIGALAIKDLRLLWRDRAAFVLAFAWPVVIAVFVGGLAPGLPARFGDAPGPGAFDLTFPQGMIWGALTCAATFGISLVTERRAGTLARLQAAPLPPWAAVAGKATACLLSAVAVQGLVLALGVAAFGVRASSWPMLGLAVLSVAAGLCGLTMLLAALGRTARSASGLTWAALMTLAMLGGAMIPLSTLPAPIQPFAMVSPVAWGIRAIEGATWRGATWLEVLPHLGALWLLTAVSIAVAARAFRPA